MRRKIRYAVVGAGHIAQVAVMPAFRHAKRNSELVALFSGDPKKRQFLKKKYRIQAFAYEEYDAVLKDGIVDAVYIALPNHLHCDYTIRAAKAGVHVLCEKPMAVSEQECRSMIAAAEEGGVKLMIAYRLHFEKANREAVKIAQSGKLGKLRFIHSLFSMQVRRGNIRLEEEMGGGSVHDIGIYCINAFRYLLKSEPYEVFAWQEKGKDDRFSEVDEMTTAILKFPEDCLATFTSSFGAADIASYQIVGAKGDLRVDPAYEYRGELIHHLTLKEKTRIKKFKPRDQFAPELIHFSDCIIKDKKPEPSGEEGLADIRIIEAIQESASSGKPIEIKKPLQGSHERPRKDQDMKKPAVKKPKTVHVAPASAGP